MADARAIRVGFVVHVMQVAGAEMLVAETIRQLGSRIDPVIFCLDAVGAMGETLRAEGVPVIPLDRRPGLDRGLVLRFGRHLRERHVDVLHAHQYTPFFYGALASLLARPRPRIVLTEHGRHFPDVVSPKRRFVNHHLLSRFADRVNAVCQFSGDALAVKDGFDRQPVEVIENGIHVDRYATLERDDACHRIGLDPARRYVVHVARFHPVKDHATLVRGFAETAAAVPDADLVLVGDGPERERIDALVGQLGLRDRVKFLGVRRDVPIVLNACDVFTLPSVSEGASLTLMEAMASGLPSVVTDVGGNPEIVRAEAEGLLVPRADATALGAAFTRLLRDPELRSRLGRAAHARAREHYRLDRTIERYHQLYEQLVRERAGARA